jgi:hypothetical protein
VTKVDGAVPVDFGAASDDGELASASRQHRAKSRFSPRVPEISKGTIPQTKLLS